MIYAAVSDLEIHMRRKFEGYEATWALASLGEASVVLDELFPLPDDPAEKNYNVRRIVVCRMVARVLAVPSESTGAGSVQQSGGPYQLTRTFSSGPAGEMYLTKADRALLHGRRSGQRAFEIDPLAGREGHP